MTILRTFIAWSLLLLASSNAANAQTVDDIINKYTDAIGGTAVLANLHSIQMEGTMKVGADYLPIKLVMVDGKGYRSDTMIDGMAIVECVTDTGGWTLNPTLTDSPKLVTTDQVKELNHPLYIVSPLVDYKSKGFSAELLGREDVDGVSDYKVRLFDSGTDITYDIDPNTYLISKATAKRKPSDTLMTSGTTFSNYQKTPIGYTVAYSSSVTVAGFAFETTYSKITFNQDIDPQIFAVPK